MRHGCTVYCKYIHCTPPDLLLSSQLMYALNADTLQSIYSIKESNQYISLSYAHVHNVHNYNYNYRYNCIYIYIYNNNKLGSRFVK